MTDTVSVIGTRYIILNSIGELEGNIGIGSWIYYLDSLKQFNFTNILEIGFNAGHSAVLFLELFPNATVTSVDLGIHTYIQQAEQLIQKWYPGRHKLIIGDSRQVIPTLSSKYDMIFIDGGHMDDIPKTDLLNCRKLATKDTILFMDDICPQIYGIEPEKAWNELVANGTIIELGRWLMDVKVLGFAWGKYLLE